MTASWLDGLRPDRSLVYAACLLVSLSLWLQPAPAFAADNSSSVVAWLFEPMDPSRAHMIDAATSWHGRLMVLIWAVLFPTGILAARFFKIMPGQDWPREVDNRHWWLTHLSTQYLGGALFVIALALALYATGSGQGTVADRHHLLGWSVTFLLAWQFLGGWLRGTKGGPTDPGPDGSLRGDHYDMTPRRRVFEYAHKIGGYIALLAACAAIVTGLYAANGPRWMWLGLVAWWALLMGLAARLQTKGFARDTYEAIWGPSRTHPGNHRRPIGFGIRRERNGDKADHAG